ncbi:MAG: ArnT family glycosyltransferase [Pirellulaceae bacterium]
MRSIVQDCSLVGMVAAVVLFTNLGGPRLWDRDEPRNAGCAREMLQRNDWVTPVFNAELRSHKPVLLYWLMMTAYAVFGVNEFAARFWPAALAVGTALCTYFIGRRMFHARAGVWAGVIVSTCLMFDVAGRAATPDSVLLFFTTLALTIYVVTTFPVRRSDRERTESPPAGASAATITRQNVTWYPASWWAAAGMYGVMGVALLAKGPVGLVLPTAVIGMFLLIQHAPPTGESPKSLPQWLYRASSPLRVFGPRHFLRTCWAMRPLTALTVSLAVALPWYLWVGLRTDGEFLRGFFLEHHFGRATQAMEGHDGPWFYYPIAILIGFFPWSVFAAPVLVEVVSRIRRRDAWTDGYVFACCWVGVYVGVFTLAKTKLPSYVTPCYPALALLAGAFLHHWSENAAIAARWWQRLALACYSVVGIALAAISPFFIREALPGEEGLAALGLIPLTGGVVCLIWLEHNRPRFAAVTFAGSAAAFVLALFAVGAARVDHHQRNHVLLQTIDAQGDHVSVAAFGCLEPTWVFYGGRPINELTTRTGAWVERQGSWVRKPETTVQKFLESSPDGFIITCDEHLTQLRELLPADYDVIAKIPYFLRKGSLMVVGASRAGKGVRNLFQPDSTPGWISATEKGS